MNPCMEITLGEPDVCNMGRYDKWIWAIFLLYNIIFKRKATRWHDTESDRNAFETIKWIEMQGFQIEPPINDELGFL